MLENRGVGLYNRTGVVAQHGGWEYRFGPNHLGWPHGPPLPGLWPWTTASPTLGSSLVKWDKGSTFIN